MNLMLICPGWRVLAVFAGLAVAAGAADAAPGHVHGCKAMSRLQVTGQGEARVTPDLAVVQIGVVSHAPQADAAMRQNAAVQALLISITTMAEGLSEADIQTSGLMINPVMDYSDGSAPKLTGYEANNVITIRVSDLVGLGKLLDSLVEAGANRITDITFLREDSGEEEDQARRAAVADARHKAEVMAGAAGLTLGPVIGMQETASEPGPQPRMRMMAADMAEGASTPVHPGQLSITAQVQVEYALTGPGALCGGEAQRGSRRGHHGGNDGGDDEAAPEQQETAPDQ
ncbi:SIMPL domain-containing protein [Paracoccus sp. (in: a-proteobacteria)]|uniref:SIMPL domain-containing protein n=1 Tax=Paracoccus sp. TaxID=267 RepID=UPI003A83FA8B